MSGQILIRRAFPKSLRVSLEYTQGKHINQTSVSDLFCYKSYHRDMDERIDYFRFDNLSAGQYRATFRWNDQWDNIRKYESEPFLVEASSVHSMFLHLPLASIKGTIVDKASGAPIAGAQCILDNGYFEQRVKCHDDGTFEGQDIPPGIYSLVIHKSGYRSFIIPKLEVLENIDIVGVLYEIVPGSISINGVLTSKNGALKNTCLWKVSPEFPSLGVFKWKGGEVFSDGTFNLTGLPPRPVKLQVFYCFVKKVAEKTVKLPLADGEKIVIEVPSILP